MLVAHIFVYLLLLSFIFNLIYKVYFAYPLIQYKDSIKVENPIDFSINLVIAVHNESKRLESVLESTKSERFRESGSKVIVVDDHSSVEEKTLMKSICKLHENVVFIESEFPKGKKHAIRFAINQFSSEYYAFTDADCALGTQWYESLCSSFSQGQFVMGYGPFYKKKGFLNQLQRFECMWIAIQYMGYAQRGIPYMAVGRNMASSGDLLNASFPKMKGDHLMSGDDDMLVQALDRKTEFSLMVNPKSFAYSEAEKTYGKYLKQKRRQISTSVHYKLIHKLLLGGVSMSMILFYALIIVCLFINPLISLEAFLANAIVNLCIFWAPTQKLLERDLGLKIIYIEPIYVINLIVLSIYSILPKKQEWK